MISYKPLLHLLIDRDLKLTNVIKEVGLSTNLVTKINNNESITLTSIEKICLYLDVKIEQIVEITR